MKFDQNQIAGIVEEVVRRMVSPGVGAGQPHTAIGSLTAIGGGVIGRGDDGVFSTIDDAINCAEAAQETLMTLTLEQRKEIKTMRTSVVVKELNN